MVKNQCVNLIRLGCCSNTNQYSADSVLRLPVIILVFSACLKCRMEHVMQEPQMMPTITRLRPGSALEVICPSKADMEGTYLPKLFAEDSVVVSGSLMWKRYFPVLHTECLMLMGTKQRERRSLNFGSTF